MAPPAAAAGAGGGEVAPGGQQRQQGGIGQSITGIIRIAVFWYFASKFFTPNKKATDPSVLISNIFDKGDSLDMWVYLSEQEKFKDFNNEGAF